MSPNVASADASASHVDSNIASSCSQNTITACTVHVLQIVDVPNAHEGATFTELSRRLSVARKRPYLYLKPRALLFQRHTPLNICCVVSLPSYRQGKSVHVWKRAELILPSSRKPIQERYVPDCAHSCIPRYVCIFQVNWSGENEAFLHLRRLGCLCEQGLSPCLSSGAFSFSCTAAGLNNSQYMEIIRMFGIVCEYGWIPTSGEPVVRCAPFSTQMRMDGFCIQSELPETNIASC